MKFLLKSERLDDFLVQFIELVAFQVLKMSHYFFNIVDQDGFVPDQEGSELPNDRAAWEEAEQSARELLANDILARREVDGRRLEVRDERGSIITSIFLRDLLH